MPRKAATPRAATPEPGAIDTAEAMPAQNQEGGKKSARKGSGSLDDLSRTALKAFLNLLGVTEPVRQADAAKRD